MIINIFGPSGSGKTTLMRNILSMESTEKFFKKYSNEGIQKDWNNRVSISLMPIPLFRGTISEFFDIFCIEIEDLLTLDNELKDLAQSIFGKINTKLLIEIASRRIETLSAGEIRRLFILKSILVESNLMIIDEPFSNSDEKLWRKIYDSINLKERSIILSHFSLQKFFDSSKNDISIHINDVNMILNYQ